MISSFHGVIARLKEKEKELTELSRIDREKAETAARMSTDMLQQMDASVFQFSSQGRVLQCNRSASDLFGAPSLVLFNQHYLKLFDGEHEWRQMIENALRLGLKEQDRLLSWKARGERQVFRVSVSPVAEPDGKRGALCIIADVTEKNRLEQQLAEKEKLAALGEMAGGLAHEVRNSLGTIVGLMRLIDTHEMLSADAARADITDNERFQFMMKKEVRELNRIVTDFLDFTRPISLRLDRIDCGEVLRHCLEEIRAQFPDRADDVQVEGQFAPIQGDDAQLRQAFFNLIKNGIESGTNVRVIVSSTVDAATNTLCLRFHDTGAGINADDIERIFIPFYTTKESGYGIGLAIVKKTILEHSGRIEVTSTPGEGTIFTIFLPIVPASSCP